MDFVRKEGEDSAISPSLTRKEVFELLRADITKITARQAATKIEESLSAKLQKSFSLSEYHLKCTVSTLVTKLKTRYKEASYNYIQFGQRNVGWIDQSIDFSDKSQTSEEKEKQSRVKNVPPRRRAFSESSSSTKRRRTSEVRQNMSTEELLFAVKMKLRQDKENDLVKILSDIANDEKAAKEYRDLYENKDKKPIPLSTDEAVEFLISLQLSSRQYQAIRNLTKSKNADILPPYKQMEKAKAECYPKNFSDDNVTDSCAKIDLQSLLNHTAERIIKNQLEMFEIVDAEKLANVTLVCKYGMDGTSGFSEYQQSFTDDPDCTKSDASIFYTALAPIQLNCRRSNDDNPLVLWHNPKPGSPKFCRPIQILCAKETDKLIKAESEALQKEINDLKPFTTVVHRKVVVVNFRLSPTMIDGKVANCITDTKSAQVCNVCTASISQFNDIDKMIGKKIIEDNLKFGMPILHAWIRFLEMCLHISYNLDFKQWQARSDVHKEMKQKSKKNIQLGLREELGINVDKVKQGGFGSSNDGNTARRFFGNIPTVAKITGFDKDLLERLYTILQVLTSGFEINEELFENYCLVTARMYVEKYPWYYMPTAIHKILIHGRKIISASTLPVGLLSEDAQESSNKYLKKFRRDYARKCDRKKAMKDLMQRLFVNSDPLISMKCDFKIKNRKSLSKQVTDMLLASSPSSNCSSPVPSSSISGSLVTSEDEMDYEDSDCE